MPETETTLARSIRTTNEQAQYDAACKKLLSEKIILAIIMKGCLKEYQNCEIQEIAEKYIEGQPQISEVPVEPDEDKPIIQGLPNEDSSLTEGRVFYDIRFVAIVPGSGERIRLIINVEAQGKFNPGYPLLSRGIYYCCRLISRQNGTEFTDGHYEKIKKVYSIWICMNPPENRKNTIRRYRMTEEHLVGHAEEPVEDYDLLSIIMVCLGDPDSKPDDQVLGLLNALLSTAVDAEKKKQILHDDFNIPMTKALHEEVAAMCNLSEGVLERGIQMGTDRTFIASIRNLMETLNLTAEQAMAALKVPPERQSIYREQLKK